ncbi:SRPBCC domain-containing protein [Sporosarcina sp. P35]|nr:SRPBCC domain-containing protein [Sporosarcina sp. P35]PID17738.1 polyketide cyclase [Sporosarcina sp. P35]
MERVNSIFLTGSPFILICARTRNSIKKGAESFRSFYKYIADWHTPFAENDLKAGGKFVSRMEAKDGSMGFDFGGIYDEVKLHEGISYTLGDGRKVNITFNGQKNETEVIETFDAETTHPIEFQQQGWQAILDNFKQYVEQTNK